MRLFHRAHNGQSVRVRMRSALCNVSQLSLLVCVLGGCTDDDGQGTPEPTSTVATVAGVSIDAADITVVTEPVQLLDGISLLPGGDLPTALPFLDQISRIVDRQLSDSPDAVGQEVLFGRLERGSSNTVGDGVVVLAVRVYGVVVVPSCPPGAKCAGPVPSVSTMFFDAVTGEQVVGEFYRGCDPSSCGTAP
jgi:hypothetical protein